MIVFGGTRGGVIRQVRESGGAVTALTALDRTRSDRVHGLPRSSCRTAGTFCTSRVTSDETTSGIFIGEIDFGKPEDQSLNRLVAASNTMCMKGERGAGCLFYLRQGTLVSHAFDAERLTLVGDVSPVANRVGTLDRWASSRWAAMSWPTAAASDKRERPGFS